MRLLSAICLFIILWGITGDAKEARSCSTSFKKHRVFKGHAADQRVLLSEALKNACSTSLSDSQVAGRVLKTCMKACDLPPENKYDAVDSLLLEENEKPKPTVASTGTQCKQKCLATIQKMAKESQRLRNSSTARR